MNQPDRYQARYRDGYYVVIDTTTGDVVPPEPNHYKRHEDGYLWDYAAVFAARDLNAASAGDTGAYARSRRREYNPNSDKPVCQGGPRWYV
jgi:hypothetical protein